MLFTKSVLTGVFLFFLFQYCMGTLVNYIWFSKLRWWDKTTVSRLVRRIIFRINYSSNYSRINLAKQKGKLNCFRVGNHFVLFCFVSLEISHRTYFHISFNHFTNNLISGPILIKTFVAVEAASAVANTTTALLRLLNTILVISPNVENESTSVR